MKSIFKLLPEQQRYLDEWQSKPLSEEDWQRNLICEISGVKLLEVAVGVYVVEYAELVGQTLYLRRSIFLDWSAAEADFVNRVAEGDYR